MLYLDTSIVARVKKKVSGRLSSFLPLSLRIKLHEYMYEAYVEDWGM